MLSALFGHQRAVTGVPWDESNYSAWGSWGGESGSTTWSGARVDQSSATQLMAVYGSASFITDEISTLPVTVDGAPRPKWVDNPTEGVQRISWMSQIVWSLLLPGNAYLGILGDPMNPAAIDVLDPAKVDVRRENGRKTFYVSGQPVGFPIVHIPGRMRPGDLVGMSPIDWCRQTIGIGLAAGKYGAEFFDGEGNMPGVIELPHPAQPETLRDLARQWQRKRKSGGRGLPGVIQNGGQWKPTGVNHEQAQFLQTRKWTAAEIAGQIFMLDPSDLGIPVEGSSLTYANLEQRNVRRLQVALMPWIRRIEAALTLLIPGGNYRFDVDSRLRGNTRESYETLSVAIAAGFMTVDEARDILGFDPAQRPPTMEAPDD
jgi:HK97 family phage portal protein